MDTIYIRLEEASRLGDVDSLKKLLQEDEFLLERVIARTSARDNPLHIAALLGHAGFTAEIVCRKPELVKELNGQGLSPLHLAAAHGHLDVVKQLLKGDICTELCFVREDKEGLMPLHVAVIKGRTVIVKELVEACEAAMHERINGGETVLHLAVKSNSLETLEFLISHVDDLNAKDDKGNTMLHLAVARKQSSVIKLLLSKPSLDVNITNSKGSTPLDVLLESQHEYGDLIIGEMIRAAHGTTTTRSQSSQQVIQDPISNRGLLCHPGVMSGDVEEANPEIDEITKTTTNQSPDMVMVVATLVATISFTAALNPPAPYQPKSDSSPSPSGDPQGPPPDSTFNNAGSFLIFDIFSLFLSVTVILLFLCVVPRKGSIVFKCLVWALWLATFSMAMAFSAAIIDIFKYDLSYKAIATLLDGWVVILMIGILWVSIRLIIFLLHKGKMLDPVRKLFSMKTLFKRLRLNGTTETSNPYSPCCKKTASIVLILFVIIGVGVIYRIIINDMWMSTNIY